MRLCALSAILCVMLYGLRFACVFVLVCVCFIFRDCVLCLIYCVLLSGLFYCVCVVVCGVLNVFVCVCDSLWCWCMGWVFDCAF